MEIDKSSFGSRQKKLFIIACRVRYPVILVCEFWKLPSRITALILQHMRDKDKLVTVTDMLVNKEIYKCPFEPCTHTAVNP